MFGTEPLVQDWLPRLLAALGAGVVIGLNRDLHHKAAGVRTHGLVALGAALLVLVGFEVAAHEPGAGGGMGRTMQGIITGVGFLGAGVIVRPATGDQVRGLTTAASIWMAAAFGIGFATGAWRLTTTTFGLALAILVVGGPFEMAMHRLFDRHPAEHENRN